MESKGSFASSRVTRVKTSVGTIFKYLCFFVVTATVLFSPVTQAYSAQSTLAWNASSDSSVVGYKLHYGTAPGSYSKSVDTGNTTSVTVTDLSEGQTYYFASTAYDSAGNQSGYSNEVSKSVPSATYTITTSAGSGGSISPTSALVNHGGSQSFTITPSSGYKVADVKVNGTSVGAVSSYTFSNVTSNQTISATFTTTTTSTISSYTITASATSGGSISPAGTVTVSAGSSMTFTINPSNNRYRISYVEVDGVSKGAISLYTFSSVAANHTIRAYFSKK